MISWDYETTAYEESKEYAPIPDGDHRVRIAEVVERSGDKAFRSGREGFEITLDVSGYGSKLWYYIVLNPENREKTNKTLTRFFDCFSITDRDLGRYAAWAGKVGGVTVNHEEYNGQDQAKVKWLMFPAAIEKLPAWKEPGGGTAKVSDGFAEYESDDELPF